MKPMLSLVSLMAGLGFASMASAATITPVNSDFTATGTIILSSYSLAHVPISCNATFKGRVTADGAYAAIDSVSLAGSKDFWCQTYKFNGLPWKLTASSPTTGKIEGVAFNVLNSTCGPSTINTTWNNTSNTLAASSQPLSGNCTINSLNVQPSPAFVVNP